MKHCSLCGMTASVFCETGGVDLCWPCDAKLHCSNLLMETHFRSLLCSVCSVATPWRGTGRRLCMTVAVCDRCRGIPDVDVMKEGNDVDDDDDDEDDEDYDDDEDDLGVSSDEMEDEDGQNQVLASLTEMEETIPPPRDSSSSGSDEDSPLRKAIHDHLALKPNHTMHPASSQDVFPYSTSSYLHNASSVAPPSGSLTGVGAAPIVGPFIPTRVQKEAPPPFPTLSQLNCRANNSSSSFSRI